jgi:hypothetical protein
MSSVNARTSTLSQFTGKCHCASAIHQKLQLSIIIIIVLSDRSKTNPCVTSLSLKAALLQLNFPAFLRECARAAAPQSKAITKPGPTNAVALTDFLASAELSPVGGLG